MFNEPQSIATPLQDHSEAAETLKLLAAVPVPLIDNIAAETDHNTEYVARQIISLTKAGRNTATLTTDLISRQNEDGGFGGDMDFESNPLDTAWALLAMSISAQTAGAPAAIAYLQSVQQIDGSFITGHHSDVYTSAIVLTALHLYGSTFAVTANIQIATGYLMAQQSAAGNWGNGAWLTAVVYQAVHDFIPLDPAASAVKTNLIGTQQADGSWGGDPFITALVLRALQLTGEAPINPALAIIQGKVIDSQTYLPIAGVTVALSGISSATMTTAADGVFTFANMQPGTYNLTVSLTNYGTLTTSTAVTASQTLNFGTLKLSKNSGIATGTIYGIVKDAANGNPLAGVTISGTGFSTQTDPNGAYQIVNVAAGDVTISASMTGYLTASSAGHVYAGGALLYSPVLSTSGGTVTTSTVTGIVMDAATNLALAGVSIAVTDGAGTRTITSGADGKFSAANLVKDSKGGVNFVFSFTQYVGTDTYVSIDGIPSVDIGQVRLRKVIASQLLPDIAVVGVSRQGSVTDPQTLIVTGQIAVTLQNQGTADVPAGIKLLAFQDVNRNGAYDKTVDTALGTITLVTPLAVGQTQIIQLPIQGSLTFRDAPIHLWADSDQTLIEISKANNIRSTAASIEIKPNPTQFAPKLKWQWSGGPVIATPMVGPLTDTNGDGKFDDKDIPTVIVVQALGIDFYPGMITALSGKDGHQLWQITDGGLYSGSETHPAIADLTGGGKPHIIYYPHGGGVAVLNHDGSLKCKSATNAPSRVGYNYGAITIADIDGDGKAEIIAKNYVLNHDCSVRMILGPDQYHQWISIVADLDGDGKPEIITPNAVYHNDGSVYWNVSQPGNLAVARLDPNDARPQVVTSYGGYLTAYRYDGRLMWGPVLSAGAYNTGAPTIADLDGNGVPSIGVAGPAYYYVYNADGSLMWKYPTYDGSAVTGSTSFDFDGSGNAKIVYFDEQKLRVFDGKTGQVAFSLPNPSATASEYPVVVDVDGDGHADILVPANVRYPQPPLNGLRVFQDINNAWVGTRKIWNQYAYHITNINDDGSVPRHEQNSWDGNNTYRLNARLGVSATAVPDVTASFIRINDQGGKAPSTITVRIGNASSLTLDPGVNIAFYNGVLGTASVLLGKATTSRSLVSGDYEDVLLSYAGGLAGITTLMIVADDDGTGKTALTDFDRSNNTVSMQLSALPGSFSLTASTNAASYAANTDVQITAPIANHGSFDGTAQVRFVIQTAQGDEVAVLPTQSLTVPHGGQSNAIAVWNTGTIIAGAYQVKAQLVDANGVPFAEASSAFSITAGGTILTASVTTDKQLYQASDSVKLADRISNVTLNLPLNNLTIVTTVTNPDGTVRFTKTETLAQLLPSSLKDYSYSVPLNAAPAGVYSVSVVVTAADGTPLAQSSTQFTVASSSTTGYGLTGTLAASPKQVMLGDTTLINFSAINNGNSTLASLSLTVNIIDPAAQKVIATFPYTPTLAIGATYSASTSWQSTGIVGTTYVAVLSAVVGTNTLSLAQDSFTVIAPPIKLDITQSIANGSRVLVLVSSNDDESEVNGNDNKPPVCLTTRMQTIDHALSALGVMHAITTNETAFKLAFRSGLYNTYWVSGKEDKLHDDLTSEIREAVYAGDGLILDGVHDQRNKVFDTVAGISYRGKIGETDLPIDLAAPLFTAQRLATVGRALKLDSNGAAQNAAFAGQQPTSTGAGILTNSYGAGHAILFAFDLVTSLQAQALWQPILGTGVQTVLPAQSASLIPAGVLSVKTTIVNQANATDVDVKSILPAGANYLSATPTATYDEATRTVDWAFNLTAAQTEDLSLLIDVPTTAGDFTLQTIVSTVKNGASTPYSAPLTLAFHVTSAQQSASAATAALNALVLMDAKDQKLRDSLTAQLQAAMTNLNKNTAAGDEAAISTLIGIIDQLSGLPLDTTAVHDALDRIIKEAQWRWSQLQPAQ